VIHAQGEAEAATTLAEAAQQFEAHPAAMQLRTLATMAEVSTERNSTLIFPLPMEFLRLADALNDSLRRDDGAGAGGTAG
jgi:hypothetical protein